MRGLGLKRNRSRLEVVGGREVCAGVVGLSGASTNVGSGCMPVSMGVLERGSRTNSLGLGSRGEAGIAGAVGEVGEEVRRRPLKTAVQDIFYRNKISKVRKGKYDWVGG